VFLIYWPVGHVKKTRGGACLKAWRPWSRPAGEAAYLLIVAMAPPSRPRSARTVCRLVVSVRTRSFEAPRDERFSKRSPETLEVRHKARCARSPATDRIQEGCSHY